MVVGAGVAAAVGGGVAGAVVGALVAGAGADVDGAGEVGGGGAATAHTYIVIHCRSCLP